MLFELEASALLEIGLPAFAGIARQQPVWRDIAVIVGVGVSHAALIDAAARTPLGLVRSATLFDVYKPAKPTAEIGPGEHSVALRLELLDEQATLNDERIDAEVASVIDALSRRLGARLRG